MKNHLISEQWQDSSDPRRCTGRTTAQILRALSDAIQNHGKWIVVIDHAQVEGAKRASEHAYHEARAMVQHLGLRHMEFAFDGPSFRIRSMAVEA